jgi:hypothetical protein
MTKLEIGMKPQRLACMTEKRFAARRSDSLSCIAYLDIFRFLHQWRRNRRGSASGCLLGLRTHVAEQLNTNERDGTRIWYKHLLSS